MLCKCAAHFYVRGGGCNNVKKYIVDTYTYIYIYKRATIWSVSYINIYLIYT